MYRTPSSFWRPILAVRNLVRTKAGPVFNAAIMPCRPDSANDFDRLQFHDVADIA
jgi:hypothetical protein